MIDEDLTISFISQDSSLETKFSHFLSTKAYQINGSEKAKPDKNSLIIIFLNDQQTSVDSRSYLNRVHEQFIKKSNSSYPTFIINMQSNSISDMLKRDTFNRIKQDGTSLVEIQVDKKFFHPFSSSSQDKQLNNKLELLWDKIQHYLTSPLKFGYLIDKRFKYIKSTAKIGVVGLGYVGLPVAMGFAQKFDVIGFDVNKEKINDLKNNVDQQGQFSESDLEKSSIDFVTDQRRLKECNYIVVTVPTPITKTKMPDLTYLKKAAATIGKNLTPQTTVIFESTVYPGTTEEVCVPILETQSQLASGIDFFVGYSPERINPGDKERMFINNPKIIAGQNNIALEKIHNIYSQVIDAKLHKAPSIKVAEASKIVENTQRDVNIALMNELSLIFEAMDIDTYEVLEAAKTKWNFIPMSPGLVGGHCIGVDPYYLIYQSKKKGYDPNFLATARAINEYIPEHVVQSLLKLVMTHKLNINQLQVSVLGITFKENIPDLRNSKALTIVQKLRQLGISTQVCDPHVQLDELSSHEDLLLFKRLHELDKVDIIILAVPHEAYNLDKVSQLKNLLKDHGQQKVIMDLKGALEKDTNDENITLWRL